MKEQAASTDDRADAHRNRRDSRRFAIEVNALLRVTAEGEDRIYQSRTRDLSAGGVSIVVDRGIGDLAKRVRSPGVRVLVALELPRSENEVETAALPVWIRSTTDWVESPRDAEPQLAIGLSFLDMGKAETEEIRSFLTGMSDPSA